MTIHAIADTKTEEQLLSHCFSSPDELDNRKLKPELFTLPKHRQLFEAMRKLRQQGEPISADGVRLIDATLEDVAKKLSLRRLGELTTRTVVAKLCEMEKRRAMQEVAAQLAEAAVSADDLDDEVSSQVKKLMTQTEDGGDTLREAGDMQELIDIIQWRSDNPGKLRGISTGFRKLDKVIDGLHSGIFSLAAATGEGKSTLAMNISVNIAKDCHDAGDKSCVLYFALEMSAIEMQLRMVSCLCGMPINESGMTHEQMRLLGSAMREMKKLNIIFDDVSHPSVEFVVNRARKLHRERGIKAIICDYAQLLKVPKSKGNDASDLNYISKTLQGLTRELDIPLINVVMLRRPEKQFDKKTGKFFIPPPSIGDVKGSSGFEEDSVVVAMIQRDADNNTKLHVLKNRHGPRNVVIDLDFQAALYRFTEK
jgi:replicative DNA helicase